MKDALNLTLQTSYRVTKSIAWFVNNIMLGEERIISNKKGPWVDYIIGDHYRMQKHIYDIIQYSLKNKYILPEDIFILSPSLKGEKSTAKQLENLLVKAGIPCYAPISDDAIVDHDIIKGKVVFSTLHQSKGLERAFVVMLGFDKSYFKYFARDHPLDTCPSTLYVGCTRAAQKLVVCQGSADKLPFLHKNFKYMKKSGHVRIYDLLSTDLDASIKHSKQDNAKRNLVVTQCIKYMKQEKLHDLQNLVDIVFKDKGTKTKPISVNNKVQSKIKDHYEEVSDITALAIISKWFYKHTSKNTLYEHCNCDVADVLFSMLDEKSLQIPRTNRDFLKLANVYQATISGYHFRVAQISRYDWLKDYASNKMIQNIEDNIVYTGNTEIEYILEDEDRKCRDVSYQHQNYGEICFSGRVDIYDTQAIWELKCVDKLTLEHFLQVVMYAFLWQILVNKGFKDPRRFYLLNIKDNSVYELDTTSYLLNEIVEIILDSNFNKTITIDDNEFISRCISYTSNKMPV
jgi:hypothetical protein